MAAAASFFTLAPLPLVLTEPAAAAVFTPAPLPLVLADASCRFYYSLPPQSFQSCFDCSCYCSIRQLNRQFDVRRSIS